MHRRRDGTGASRRGALKDMEMMQFHPTTLAPTGVLITEGCRGEGGVSPEQGRERFLVRDAPNAMELASRDVISRAEQTEIDDGRGHRRQRPAGPAPPRRWERILERLHGTRREALQTVGAVVTNLVLAIRASSAITLVAAMLVLGGALAAGHRHRVYDAVILKTLGATRARLIGAYALEGLMIGLATAVFGLLAGTVAAWLIVTRLMTLNSSRTGRAPRRSSRVSPSPSCSAWSAP